MPPDESVSTSQKSFFPTPKEWEALRFFIQEAIRLVEGSSELPSLFHNIDLALLSILIPLSIAILVDVYQKKKDKEEDFVELDLQVIFDVL